MHPDLNHPVYSLMVKLTGYNCRVNVFTATTNRNAAHILVRFGNWTAEEHTGLSVAHELAYIWHQREWSRLADEAAQVTWGRPFKFGDYRISGIASDEFPEQLKLALRVAAHSMWKHKVLQGAHAAAVQVLRQIALRKARHDLEPHHLRNYG